MLSNKQLGLLILSCLCLILLAGSLHAETLISDYSFRTNLDKQPTLQPEMVVYSDSIAYSGETQITGYLKLEPLNGITKLTYLDFLIERDSGVVIDSVDLVTIGSKLIPKTERVLCKEIISVELDKDMFKYVCKDNEQTIGFGFKPIYEGKEVFINKTTYVSEAINLFKPLTLTIPAESKLSNKTTSNYVVAKRLLLDFGSDKLDATKTNYLRFSISFPEGYEGEFFVENETYLLES